MRWIDRQAIRIASADGSVSELLGRHIAVAVVAQVARVFVLVAAAQRERLDVIDHCGEGRQPSGITSLTQAIGPGQTALALLLSCTTAKAINHSRAPARALQWRSAQLRR